MDNATYDVLNCSPSNSNETYSTLTAISTNFQDNKCTNGYKRSNSKHAASTKYLVAIIVLIVILSLITITSLALSVAAYNQQKLELSMVQSQQSSADGDTPAEQTQLTTTCNSLSQLLFKVDTKINNLISLQLRNTDMKQQPICGPGLWYQVAHLNMSDPSQQCPCAWREYTNNGIRVCGRPITSTSCATKSYLTSNQYSRMCGRIIGYQFNSPDAFRQYEQTQIDFDGINITIGAQHSHIWSYVAGHTQEHQSNCPCASQSAASPPQPYIGDNYYCDSGEITNMLSNDPLWDGQHCENNCCTGPPGTNSSPPWFTVELPVPTTDTIEVSICCDQETEDEDTPIELLEIYIQ